MAIKVIEPTDVACTERDLARYTSEHEQFCKYYVEKNIAPTLEEYIRRRQREEKSR